MNYATFYARNAEAFLSIRKLSFEDLEQVVRRQYEDAKLTLITSSPVHGVANAASDIDLICITHAARSDGAMASQIHHDGHHMEVVAFSGAEVDQATATLRDSHVLSARDQLRLYRTWDKQHTISRKYLERIITGVASDRGVPFVQSQNALGDIWATASFDAFRQSVGFAMLALRCEEYRAAAGYASNALLYLMNAMLSKRGWTVSNKKWTLLRWRHASGALGIWTDSDQVAFIDSLWQTLYPACVTGLTQEHAAPLLELTDEAERLFAYQDDYAALVPAYRTENSTAFLPGNDFVMGDDGRATLMPKLNLGDTVSTHPRDLLDVSPDIARYLLNGARAGLVQFSLADALQVENGVLA